MYYQFIRSLTYTSTERPARVLFFVPFGSWIVHNQLDAVMSCALQLRGTAVSAVLCNGLYQEAEHPCYAVLNDSNPSQACQACGLRGVQLFEAFHTPTLQLRDYLDPELISRSYAHFKTLDLQALLDYRVGSFDVGKRMCGTVCSYHRVTLRSITEPDVFDSLCRFMSYAVGTYEGCKRLFQAFDATHVFMWNGAGFSQTAAVAATQDLGLDVVTHERGLYDGAFMLSSNDVAGGPNTYLKYTKTWEEIPLTTTEATRVRDYYLDREKGKGTNFLSFYDFSTEDGSIRETLNIPSHAKIISVYTSSEWELPYQLEHYGTLARQMEGIDTLLKIFKHNPEFKDTYLVIRHHPSMGFGPSGLTRQMDMLDKAYEQATEASENVRIIMPDEKITSYALLWNSDAAISFGSTIRHEASVRGVPAASIDALFLSQGVSHSIGDYSEEGFAQLLQGMLAHAHNFRLESWSNLYRFAYTFHFRHSVRLKSCGIKNNFEPDIRISHMDELRPGNDPVLDRICDHITKGRSLYELPDQSHWLRSDEEEQTFLQTEFTRVKDYRQRVRQATLDKEQENSRLPRVHTFHLAAHPTHSLFFRSSWHRQQYGAKTTSTIDCPPSQTLSVIRDQLRTTSSELVAFTADNFHYDERWILQSVRKLLEQPQSLGVLSAAWVTENGKIRRALFSGKDKVDNTPPDLAQTSTTILCFGCYRRIPLLDLIEKVLLLPSNEQTQALFHFLFEQGSCQQLPVPHLRVEL